jgi:hypothetical protein
MALLTDCALPVNAEAVSSTAAMNEARVVVFKRLLNVFVITLIFKFLKWFLCLQLML